MCVCVCVCVCERERERERGVQVRLWVCCVSTHINERGVDVVRARSVLLQSQHHSAVVICEGVSE